MSDFFSIDGNVSPYVNSYNEESSIFALLGTPRDAKSCNYYQYRNSVVVETIAQYLDRVFPGTRSAGAQVIMLLPKVGYVPLASYPKADFSAALGNFDVKYYTFIGGLADVNFVEIPPSHPPVTIHEESVGLAEIGDDQILKIINNPELKDGLISGGIVSWIEGYTYLISTAIYRYLGVVSTIPGTTITLTASDLTNPRIDLVVLTFGGGYINLWFCRINCNNTSNY